jgi:flagellar hook-associated protein 2
MAISSAGIGSGLDVASIVSQLVAAERAPAAARIDRDERRVDAQISALGSLRSAFDALREAVGKLSSDDSARARKVTLGEDAGFSASAAAGAATGDYQVEVLALATAHKLSSAAHADGDAVVGTGTLTIASGETSLEVVIDSSNNTLAGIRDAINAAADGAGVTATIVNADDGAHLVLSATETGAANALVITASGGDGGLASLTNASMTTLGAAADAKVEVDGMLRTSAGNRLTDLVEGVTLVLTGAAPGTVTTLSIAGDPSVLRGAAKSMVAAYNRARDAIDKATAYNADTNIAAALNGDAMVRGTGRDLREAISSAVTDLDALGISIDDDGRLALDEAAFDKAIAEDATPAARLFGGAEGSLVARLEHTLAGLLDEDGMLDERDAGLKARNERIDEQRLALDRRMSGVEARYRAQFTALDVLVSRMQSTSSFIAQQLANLPS